VDSKYQDLVNTEGETLIPPTLLSFAKTFSADLESSLGLHVPVITGNSSSNGTIFMTIATNSSAFVDAAGRPSSEGYSLEVKPHGIVITGASPLGAWWATRTIIQQGVLDSSMALSVGSAVDTPGWGIRGTFVSLMLRSKFHRLTTP
jgi:hexosaminidase